MEDITRVTVTATAPEDAEYLHDLIVAARIAQGQDPIKFASCRTLRLRVPTGEPTVFVVSQPIAGIEGIKILAEETSLDNAGDKLSSESVLGKYVYAAANPADLEVIQYY